MKRRQEAEILKKRNQLESICQTVPAASLPLVHYIGARLSQDDVAHLRESLEVRGLAVDVLSKGHEVHILPKRPQE